jgi:hypothetical protein
MNEKIKASNMITLFVVVHLAVLTMAWVAYAFVAKSYPEQMSAQSDRMQLIPVDRAMWGEANSLEKTQNQHKH